MKRVVYFILAVFLMLFNLKAEAAPISFDEAFSQNDKKPMLVLIYANWADNYQVYIDKFRGLEREFGNIFNYVELDIASPDAKSFNSRYHIYPHVPYILMFRNSGKVSRYIQRDCANNESCMVPRVKMFIQ